MENLTYRLSLTGLTGYWEEGEEEIKVRFKRAEEHRTQINVGSREKDEVWNVLQPTKEVKF